GRCSGLAVSARLGPGAQVRASLSDSRPLSERRERSERSEIGRAGPRRAGTAQLAQSADHPG
ncbi:MAG: hypothetical protein Q8Q84_22665, partial [Hydrogenophaga sp.]|nr:hypothetical protein [Hydrogenophaga sp.]